MRFTFLILVMLALAACTAAPAPATPPPDTAVTSPPAEEIPTSEPQLNPLFPQPGDEQLTRGEAFVNESGLLIRESFPPQVALSISGDLPTPCHQLRVAIDVPDSDNRINITVYSVVDPEMACIQVLEPFEEMVDLGSFPSGHYSVWVNGEAAGEFDS